MERTIVYRAGNFINGLEVSSGYYLTFHQAQAALDFKTGTDRADGDYGLVTEFDAATQDLQMDNREAMTALMDKNENMKYSYFI